MIVAVTLEEVLLNRERRAERQQTMARRTGAALLSFTMCIPGPVKTGPRIVAAFAMGLQSTLDALKEHRLEIVAIESLSENTGPEGLIAVNGDPLRLKELTWAIEENHPCGRLFDLDVLDRRLTPFSRRQIGKPERSCLICDQPAHECARARRHSPEELRKAVRKFLMKATV